MLKAIEIENFKAFGERTRIELAPITLIFGENSGGKSSILQVLSLLKQTYQNREHGAILLPRVTGGIVDLGSYRNVLFDHDPNRHLSIRFDMELEGEAVRDVQPFLESGRDGESLGLQIDFACPESVEQAELEALTAFVNNRKVARFAQAVEARQVTTSQNPELGGSRDDGRGSVANRVPVAACAWVADDIRAKHAEFVDKVSNWIAAKFRLMQMVYRDTSPLDKLLKKLDTAIEKGKGKLSQRKLNSLERDLEKCERIHSRSEKAIQRMAALARQMLPEDRMSDAEDTRSASNGVPVEGDIVERVCDFYKSEAGRDYLLKEVFNIDTMLSVELDWVLPKRRSAGNHPVLDTLSKLDYPGLSPDLFSVQSFDWTRGAFVIGTLALRAGQMLRSTIESVYPLGPYRVPPERWYVFAGTSPHEVGHRGQFLPDLLFRDRELVKQTNEWLDRLGIGYHVEPNPLRSGTCDLYVLSLIDHKRSSPVEVGLSDVGFGVSQLLPLVVQSLAQEKKIITIEQPEVHVHPRLQADIADLLIESIQDPRKNQFIVETHSEHLILRLLRRIRETHRGCLPDGHPGLRPEDVSVIYVQRTDSGSQARKIDIDLNGEFVQPWPDDFFELDFHERFS